MSGVKPNSCVRVEESLVPATIELIMSAVSYDYGVDRKHPGTSSLGLWGI